MRSITQSSTLLGDRIGIRSCKGLKIVPALPGLFWK